MYHIHKIDCWVDIKKNGPYNYQSWICIALKSTSITFCSNTISFAKDVNITCIGITLKVSRGNNEGCQSTYTQESIVGEHNQNPQFCSL